MSKKNPNPFTNPPKKKKHLWWLWIPLITIASIVLVPVGFVFGLFYDPSHYDTGVNESIDAQGLINDIKLNLFDNCRDNTTDPSIDIAINETNLNKLLYGVSATVNQQLSNATGIVESFPFVKVEQFDVEILDDRYIFDVEAGALNFFKTHARVVLKVSINTDLPGGEKGFIFDVLSARVGRLDGMVEAASSFINLKQMIEGIEQLSWTYDEANTRILYPNANFQQDLINLAGLGDGGLFGQLFNTFFEQDLFKLTSANKTLAGKISIKDFRKNDNFYSDVLTIKEQETSGGAAKLMLNVKAEQIEALLNHGVIALETAESHGLTLEEACLVAHRFLAFGIDFLTETKEQNYLNEILMPNAEFKALMGNKTVEQYSQERKLAYFGETNTEFVEEIKENALSKVTGLIEAASQSDQELVASFEGLTYQQIIEKINNNEPIEVDPEALKVKALFKGIKGKIQDTNEHAWYLYGGNNTTYYYNNQYTHFDKLYARAYNSHTNTFEAPFPGVRMFYRAEDIWSYDIPEGYDSIAINNGITSETIYDLPTIIPGVSPDYRYMDNNEWKAVPESVFDTDNNITLYDSNIHDILKANPYIMGFGFPFAGQGSDGTYKYAYTMVDNIYPVTKKVGDNTYFALVFGLNINGTETQLVLPCVHDSSYSPTEENVFGLRFSIQDATMYYGNIEVPGVKSILQDLMKNAASTMSSSFFSIDGEATMMTFNIDLRDLVTTGDFKTLHDHLISNDPGDELACNAKLFVNIVPTTNSAEEATTKGEGGFKIEVGYVART